jgi:hypothetical protein
MVGEKKSLRLAVVLMIGIGQCNQNVDIKQKHEVG